MLRAAARALATAIVFLAALVLGFVVHLDVAAPRRAVVARVNQLLTPVFAGKLTIDRVGSLGLTSLAGVDAHVDDPDGTTVIRATGIAGRFSTVLLLRSLVAGEIDVEIPEASLASAEVNLDTDDEGTPRIAKAFLPRTPSTSTTPGPSVRLSMPRLHLGHVSVRGRIAGAPPLDGDVDDADGSLAVTPGGKVAIDVPRARFALRALPGGLDARGDAVAHLALPSPQGHDFGLRVSTHATVGTIAAQADATYDGGQVDATVDVPAATPEQVRALWSPWPVAAPASVHAEVHGALPQLAVRAHVSLDAATLDVDGPVTVVPRLGASLHLDAKRIDARALFPGAPHTDLGASGDVSIVTKPDGALVAQVAMDVAAGKVESTATPSAAVTGQVTLAPGGGGLSVTAKAALHEPGAPTVVTARLVPKKGSYLLTFQVETNAPDLARVPLLGRLATGRALGQAQGTIDLGAGVIDARLSVAGEQLAAAGSTASAARVEVHAAGPLSAPVLDVQVAGEYIEVWRLQCSTMTATARVGVDGGLTLRDVDLATSGSDQRASATAKLVRIAGDRVLVEDAVVRGFGAPIEATLKSAPGRLYLRARSGELDLARIARFGRFSFLHEGRASLDVDATVGHGVAEGKVDVDVSRAAFGSFKDASAHVQATLHGRQAAGHVTASVGDIGSIDVQSSSVQIGEGGPVLSMSSWRRAWGTVDARAHVDLPKLIAQLPAGTLPIRIASGVLDLTARVERDSMNDASPAVDVTAATTGLMAAGGSGAVTWRVEGLDPTLHVTVDGDTGATAVEVAVHDATGPIVQVDATSRAVPYERIASGDGLFEALRAMPFDARLTVPERSLESLPSVLGLGDLHGTLHASVEWHGAVASPTLSADARLVRERGDTSASVLPVDLLLTARYDGAHAQATLQGLNRDKIVLDASGGVDAKAGDLLAGFGGADVPWTASARAKLNGLSLRAFTFLSDRQVRGRASGELTLDRLHDDAHASATLTFDGLMVGDVACRSARMQASLDGHAFDVTARVEQDDAGYVDLRAHAGAHWGRALAPSLDAAQPADTILTARNFRAQLLLPFVTGTFTQLDGRIDADARVDVDPTSGATRPQATIALTAGAFELVSLGGEFADVSGSLKVTPDGLIHLENFVAHPLTGTVEAAATARMVGLAFKGARATVQIARNAAIPVVFDGVQMGTLDGHFDVDAEPGPDRGVVVTISVPNLHMALPDTGTHDVQALGDLEGVTTGAHLGAAGFVEVPLDATVSTGTGGAPRAPIKLDIRLGNDVQVTRGTDLDVRLQGEPIVTIADEVPRERADSPAAREDLRPGQAVHDRQGHGDLRGRRSEQPSGRLDRRVDGLGLDADAHLRRLRRPAEDGQGDACGPIRSCRAGRTTSSRSCSSARPTRTRAHRAPSRTPRRSPAWRGARRCSRSTRRSGASTRRSTGSAWRPRRRSTPRRPTRGRRSRSRSRGTSRCRSPGSSATRCPGPTPTPPW